MASAGSGRSMLRAVRRLGAVQQVLHQRGPCWMPPGVGSRLVSTSAEPVEKFRADYAAPPFTVPAVDLCFVLGIGEQPTSVTCTLEVQRSPSATADSALRLDGEDIVLHTVYIDGRLLVRGTDFDVDDSCLTILPSAIPSSSSFFVKTHSSCSPHENFQLSGLYKSSGMFCTQCEAEGFRRIAYHYDRPDIMAKYKVRIEADLAENPVLLSNGNKVAEGVLPGGMHYSEWEDPWPKPSYLFALVAGDLGVLCDTFTTMTGREVQLAIYSEHDKIDQCHHSMLSLKQSMEWDEKVFGLEYDLDIFNIVAVSDFNMGAMENKSLNVFNTSAVLATPEMSTDDQLERVAGIVAHEYFHNYTGNRVTCRDWFQLTLKEGLTVYRDQLFSADLGSAAVKRIEDVRALRAAQFPEDAGPTAHPIRPDSYIAMDNFYTATVYEKGAQVIRMYETLLGKDGFRKGMDLYFARHDGQAVTCDDFRASMADANGVADGLEQFELWYLQAGTPEVVATPSYDSTTGRYTLLLEQSCAPSPGQPHKAPFIVPVAIGLVDHDTGEDIIGTQVLELREASETFAFEVGSRTQAPTLSLLRDFSAPVKASVKGQSPADLAFLMGADHDSFVRWDSGQTLATSVIMGLVDDVIAGRSLVLDSSFVNAARAVISSRSDGTDLSLIAYTLSLPTEGMLADTMREGTVDPGAIHTAREFVVKQLSESLHHEFHAAYTELASGNVAYEYTGEAISKRRLANMALRYLCAGGTAEAAALAKTQLESADNMTDENAAFECLLDCSCVTEAERTAVIQAFERRWEHDALVMDGWFGSQAVAKEGALEAVRKLLEHPQFKITNPNKVRSLVGRFAMSNLANFHDPSGAGYAFLAEFITELDPINPQAAARMTTAFRTWRRLEPGRRGKARSALETIRDQPGASPDTYEVAMKTLGDVLTEVVAEAEEAAVAENMP